MSRDTDAGMPGLHDTQRWLQTVIAHPGTVEEALESAEAAQVFPPERLGEMIRPSWSLEPAERVEIYHGMYLLRMVEALATDYPALQHYLGEEAFEELVEAYVARFPSRSYTLNRLGDHLPEFLDTSDWADAAFLADLARLELAITGAFDAPQSETLTAEALQQVPPEAWEEARLEPVPSLHLLALRHDVLPHLKAFHNGRPNPRPRRRATWIAVHRQNLAVYHLQLSRAAHALLESLVQGTPLGEALAQATAGVRTAKRQDQIFTWFRQWVADGFFAAVEVASQTS
ncbi:MAG TPA: DUF2063 domain-containing protein [Acidobacteria bacterium]|nr:DUF2063 domain-containing protein [Acidobacteriota bacterium]